MTEELSGKAVAYQITAMIAFVIGTTLSIHANTGHHTVPGYITLTLATISCYVAGLALIRACWAEGHRQGRGK